MAKLEQVTLLIPTHQRHNYLSRILEYYEQYDIKIIIADSSINKYDGIKLRRDVKYFHLPGVPLPQKLSMVFKLIETKYVVMCSDDDFIIPAGINKCVDFLEKNQEFSSAQGNSLSYKKQRKYTGSIRMNVMYQNQLSFEIADHDPYKRLWELFNDYRGIYSAVHFTKSFQLAFNNIRDTFSNLFLNEYLTGIIPIIKGSYKELPILYQVREYAEISEDKSTDNLDKIYHEGEYEVELSNYLEYVSDIISKITLDNQTDIKNILNDVLKSYAEKLANQKLNQNISLVKTIGNIIGRIPLVGKKIVLTHRSFIQNKNLLQVIKTKEDKEDLKKINNLILKHA